MMQLKASGLLICMLCGVVACASPAGSAAARHAYPIPDVKKDCTTCHIVEGPAKKIAGLKMKPSELCLGCHPDRKAAPEHVVDVVPSMKVKGLPLTEGKITCITCHDPHRNPYGELLRVEEAKLCSRCHPL